MMKYWKKQFFAVLMILCMVWIAGCSDSDDTEPKPINLTIVHVNDTHSHLEATSSSLTFGNVQTTLDIGGVARLAAKVRDVRSKSENTLVLHAGDAVQGTLYFTKYEGAADMDFMNDMKFDAMAVGNHEFDKGSEFLAKN
ncbi:MAG: hypothetical protein HC887_12985 [Desulfobacteraceae bacterium]|nr:hypothetical protein [Desulfobacteraceae bacterium]